MKLFLSLLITLAVGGVAGFATASAIGTWYATLNKPFFNPPNWLFAPVWTLLYILMGIALYLVWRLPAQLRKNAMILFFAQLALNFAWSFIFFTFHQIGIAFVEIVLLWLVILMTINQFAKLQKTAALLLVPYILWVSFAAVLNGSLWFLNK
jgi:tryptophan-rich sensory protein